MIHVRAATVSDADILVDFQMRMAQESEGIALDLPTVRLGVAAVFADPGKGRYFIAESDGQVVGGLLTVPEWSDWRNGTVLWIHSVYVSADFRRQGVFRAMYSHLKSKVESDSSLRGLRLYVHRDNNVAQRTYSEMGMDGEYYKLFEWMKS